MDLKRGIAGCAILFSIAVIVSGCAEEGPPPTSIDQGEAGVDADAVDLGDASDSFEMDSGSSTLIEAEDVVEAPPEDIEETEIAVDESAEHGKIAHEKESWMGLIDRVGKHEGKVVVIDIWSIHCEPCLRELPKLAELQDKYPDDVVCMSFNIDYGESDPDDAGTTEVRIHEWLEKLNLDVINLLSTEEDFYQYADFGAVPAIRIFSDGKHVETISNDNRAAGEEFTYEDDVIPLIDELVKQKASGNADTSSENDEQ